MAGLTRILATGGMGFIGSNFVRLLLSRIDDLHLVNVDKLSYSSNQANLDDVQELKNFHFVKGDICDRELVKHLSKQADTVVNFAAETHVDRSISDPRTFVRSNTDGVLNLLEACRGHDLSYMQISTDEVYGSSQAGYAFKETDRLNPSSPYSASKAAADELVNAYHKTYGLRTTITRCTNNYGPYQFPEKLIPKTIIRASNGSSIPIYGSGQQVRDWIHVQDHCEALLLIMGQNKAGEIYNIAGGSQFENVEVVRRILTLMGKPSTLMKHVEDRPGHDFRYRLDTSKIERELRWKPRIDFESGLKQTVDWYVNNEEWWKPAVPEALDATHM
jgi:dTDP-glucose 4,6-dehydratase